MPDCNAGRVLEGVTNPFEIRFQPLIEDIQKQKGELEGSHAAMVLHENMEVLCAQQSGKPCRTFAETS